MNDPQQMPSQVSGMMQYPPVPMDPNRATKVDEENCHVAKLLHILHHSDVNVMYQMLLLAKRHLTNEFSGPDRTVSTLSALVYATFRFASRVFAIERRNVTADPSMTTTVKDETNEPNNKALEGGADPEVNQNDERKTMESVRYDRFLDFQLVF